MANVNSRRRQVKGTPVGGQFAVEPRSEAPIGLVVPAPPVVGERVYGADTFVVSPRLVAGGRGAWSGTVGEALVLDDSRWGTVISGLVARGVLSQELVDQDDFDLSEHVNKFDDEAVSDLFDDPNMLTPFTVRTLDQAGQLASTEAAASGVPVALQDRFVAPYVGGELGGETSVGEEFGANRVWALPDGRFVSAEVTYFVEAVAESVDADGFVDQSVVSKRDLGLHEGAPLRYQVSQQVFWRNSGFVHSQEVDADETAYDLIETSPGVVDRLYGSVEEAETEAAAQAADIGWQHFHPENV